MNNDKPNSYKVEVQTDSTGQWYGNALRFPDEAQAAAYGRNLAGRWMAVNEHRVAPSSDPATDTFSEGKLGKVP